MDRFEAMTILLRVVDKGSFSGASRDLGVPLATVSRKVNELTKLLLRTTRKVEVTDAGAAYVTSARRILGPDAFSRKSMRPSGLPPASYMPPVAS